MRYFIFPFVVLAGCGGGGGGPGAPVPVAFDALSATVQAPGVAPFASLPASGAVNYAGLARLNLPLGGQPASIYQGNIAVRVDFGAPAITGAISGLQGGGGAVTGQLQIDNGMVFPEAAPARDYQFTADLGGTLVQGGQSHTVDATLSGDFFGPGGTGISGVIYQGAVRRGADLDVFDGAFAAQRSGG